MGLLQSITNYLSSTPTGTGSYAVAKINQAYATNFSTNNTFVVSAFSNSDLPAEHFLSGKNVNGSIQNLRAIGLSMLSFNVGAVTTNSIEEWIGNTWVYTTGKPSTKLLTMTFRDHTAGKFHKEFRSAWWYLKNKMADKQMWNIDLSTINDADSYRNQTLAPIKATDDNNKITNPKSKKILSTGTAILTSVGELTLDKTQGEDFTTFSVTFTYFITNGLN